MQRVQIDQGSLRSLLVLASVIEARDAFTGGHVWRTSRYAARLADAAGLDEGAVFMAQLGGLVHDLGKIGIPDAILNKRGKVTPNEYEVIRRHPEIGHDIVVNHPLAPLVAASVAQHHLRADGGGYPDRFLDAEPAVVSRAVTIADAFDAMTSFRPYRYENPVERALRALEAERGGQFDAAMTDVFVRLVRKGDLDHVLGHAGEGRLMLTCRECGPIIAPPRSADDGSEIVCPACTAEYVLHFSRDTFELEWTGRRGGVHSPRPDIDAVEEILRDAPAEVDRGEI